MDRINRGIAAAVLLAATSFGLANAASADEWLVTKLRGSVLQLEAGSWIALERGDIVADDRALRTLASGRVELQRGAEVISLGPNTQAEIHDRPGARFTTVEQVAGIVTIEAEVRNVKHFAVETPFLAAVVKGTRFEVRSSAGGSSVKVLRGVVAVVDLESGESIDVPAGEEVGVGKDNGLHLGADGGLALGKGLGRQFGQSGGNAGGNGNGNSNAGGNGNGNGHGNGGGS